MRKLIPILLFVMMASGTAAQVLREADQMPYFPGCEHHAEGSTEKRQCSNRSVIAFISNYLEYPEAAKQAGVEGTVYVSFVVEKNGAVTQPQLLRDIGNGCGEAALEVVERMPAWEPAQNGKEKVAVQMNLPVKFAVTGRSDAALYKIHWGALNTNTVSQENLLANMEEPIQVRDLYGNAIPLGELLFTYEKKRIYLDAKSNGKLNKDMRKILKRSRKGGTFAVVATIQRDGEFVYVERVFDIVE